MAPIIKTSVNEAFRILDGHWLKIIGMVVLIYFIQLVLSTLPVQGTISIQMSPLAVASSENLQSMAVASLVNSTLFFIMIHYITNTAHTMRNRFLNAWTYPFRNWKLLYKGWIVLFISNFFLYVFGMMIIYALLGGLFLLVAGLDIFTGIALAAYLLVFLFILWLFLGLSQAMYLLYDDPEKGILSSIKESFSLMKGYKLSLLGIFLLTGIGMIVGVILLVIGAILSLVIFEVVRLAFYRELLRRKRRQEWSDKVNNIS